MARFRRSKASNEIDCVPGIADCFIYFKGVVARAREQRVYEHDDMFLVRPDTEKVKTDVDSGNNRFLAYATCAMRGWRSSMEDDHYCQVDAGGDQHPFQHRAFFSIFDGHAGRACASFCAANVGEAFRGTEEYGSGNYSRALQKAFLGMDEQMLKNWPTCFQKLPALHGISADIDPDPYGSFAPGCTAISVFVEGNVLYVANAGDCRAMLCRSGEAYSLSTDHTPDLPDELLRIAAAGGRVQDGRVNGCLAMTRALGDFQFKKIKTLGPEDQMITAKPDVVVEELTPKDEFLLIGCDGIWERWESNKVISFVSQQLARERRGAGKMSNVLAALFDKLLAPDLFSTDGLGLDNMTCILVDLRQ
jgi:serine/threonine protein phosphatase PrpC